MKIGIIGVGKLGKDVGEVMASAPFDMTTKHDIIGYDINKVQPLNFPMVESLKDVCNDRDIIFVAVPTPHDPDYDGRYPTSHLPVRDFDYSIVKDVLLNLNDHLNKNQLVVLISTVLPGTIRREFIPLIKNYKFIYNPYLIAMGTVKWDVVNPEMVIIGTEDGSTTGDAKLLIEFYKTIIKENTRIEIGTWDEAESIKIFYNTFISTKISFVNMIQDVAEKNGNIDVDVVTGALEKSTQRIISKMYMKAGMGDGGGCHPRDNIALRYLAERLELGYDFFENIIKTREKQAENIAKKLVELHKKYDLPIVILGKSYKPSVEYIDGSASILVGHYVNKMNVNFTFDETPIKAIYLLTHMNSYFEFNYPDGSIILDVWRNFNSTNKKIKIIKYGNTRKPHNLF
jgi:UDPglucose 6-dehydrogenase